MGPPSLAVSPGWATAYPSSDSIRSSGAARSAQCHTGRGVPALAQRGLGLPEQPGELGEVAFAVGPQRRLQRGRVTPAGDDVGIGVFLAAAGAEQVIQQRFDVLPA
jgi:hypothetical protein